MAQEQLWYLDQMFAGTSFFNTSYPVRLRGMLDVQILERAVNELISRHETLRTTLRLHNGQLVQVIAPTLSIALAMVDLRAMSWREREEEVQRLAHLEARQPFNLAQGPLLRLCLWRLDEQEHVILLMLHHSISDRWSLGVFLRELILLYRAFSAGTPSPLPALPIQYADFAYWQRHWQRSVTMRSQLAYWKRQLRGPLRALALPTVQPRPQRARGDIGRQALTLPLALFDSLNHLSRSEGSTLFMTCVAAVKILLYSYTGQEDLRIATPVANRRRPETEGVIGCFTNTVVLRTHLGGNPTCREVLRRVRASVLAAYAHQELPFEVLVRTLERDRGLTWASLAQVMVIWQHDILSTLSCSAPSLSFLDANLSTWTPEVTVTAFDVLFVLRAQPSGLEGTCVYNVSRFEAATMGHMLAHFQDVLACFCTQPEQRLSTFRTGIAPTRHA